MLLVIFFHWTVVRAISIPWETVNRIVHHGYLGVDLFFVISGFLLALPWFVQSRAGLPAPASGAFYRRRLRRIAPAYYLHLLLLFVVVLPLLRGPDYWRSDLYVYALNAGVHGVFLQNLSPLTSASMGVNGALWTLAVEAQFYALLPLLAPLFVKRPTAMMAACLAISIAWRLGMETDFLRAQLPAYAAHFAVGIVLGRAWLDRSAAPSPLVRPFAFVLSRGPLPMIGRISYSAYLYHLPLLYLWNRHVKVGGPLSLTLYLAATMAIAWLSWRFIERRFHPEVGVRLPNTNRGQTPVRGWESDPC